MPAPTKNPVGDGVYNVPSLCHSFRMTFYIHQIYYQVVGKAVARPPRLGNIIRMAVFLLEQNEMTSSHLLNAPQAHQCTFGAIHAF